MARAYLIFIVVAGLFASLLPSGKSSAPSRSMQRIDLEAVDASKDGTSVDPNSGAVEIKRGFSGHFYADANINGLPVRVLVDTGASGIALTRRDARRIGLAVSAGMFQVVGQGANGDVRGEHVLLDRVSLGSATAQGVPAVVLDSGEQSLLGQSFLSQFDAVEIRGDTMVLR